MSFTSRNEKRETETKDAKQHRPIPIDTSFNAEDFMPEDLQPFSPKTPAPQEYLPPSPQETAARIDKIVPTLPLRERTAARWTFALSSLGPPLNATIGILTKLAGASLGLAFLPFAIILGVGGGLSLLLGYAIYRLQSQQTLKDTAKLQGDIDTAEKKLSNLPHEIEQQQKQAFLHLLELKKLHDQILLDGLAGSKKLAARLEFQINKDIQLLAGPANQINFNQTQSTPKQRIAQLKKLVWGFDKSKNIEGIDGNTPEEKYINYHFSGHTYDLNTFKQNCQSYPYIPKPKPEPQTWRSAWKSFSNSFKPVIVPSFWSGLSAFTGSIALSYLSVAAATGFAAVSIGTGPFGIILGLSALIGYGTYRAVKYLKTQNELRKAQYDYIKENVESLTTHKNNLTEFNNNHKDKLINIYKKQLDANQHEIEHLKKQEQEHKNEQKKGPEQSFAAEPTQISEIQNQTLMSQTISAGPNQPLSNPASPEKSETEPTNREIEIKIINPNPNSQPTADQSFAAQPTPTFPKVNITLPNSSLNTLTRSQSVLFPKNKEEKKKPAALTHSASSPNLTPKKSKDG